MVIGFVLRMQITYQLGFNLIETQNYKYLGT